MIDYSRYGGGDERWSGIWFDKCQGSLDFGNNSNIIDMDEAQMSGNRLRAAQAYCNILEAAEASRKRQGRGKATC